MRIIIITFVGVWRRRKTRASKTVESGQIREGQ